MPLGEEILDKGVECFKEVVLYTPSGAVTLQYVTSFMPLEATHLLMIFCCPLIVITAKHRRLKRKRAKESREVVTQN